MRSILYGCAALALTSGVSIAATYNLEVVALNECEATGANELSINNSGTIAYEDFFRNPPNGPASDNHFQIRSVDVQGNVVDSFVTPCICGKIHQSPILNDAGQVLVIANYEVSGGRYQEPAILEADGVTKTILAEQLIHSAPDRPGIPNFGAISTQIAVSTSGDVADFVTPEGGSPQILKFQAIQRIC